MHFDHMTSNQSEFRITAYIGVRFRIWLHFVIMQLTVIVSTDFVSNCKAACLAKSVTHLFLDQVAWQKLQDLRSILEQNEAGVFSLKGGEWQLIEDLSIHIPDTGDQFVLRASDQSMLLDIQEYKYLVSHADMPKEELLGLYVFKEMVKSHLDKVIANLLSKNLVDAMEILDNLFDTFFKVAIPYAARFIKHLAEEAYRNSFILEHPHDTYKLVMDKHLSSIKKELTPRFTAPVANS